MLAVMKYLFVAGVMVALWTGCSKSAATGSGGAAGAGGPTGAAALAPPPKYFVPTAAQGKLSTIKLWVGPEEVDTEMALTLEQQATGMMYRTNLAEGSGMIFVRPQPERASFWMTNCPLPLSAAYIDTEGTILEVHELHANDPTPVLSETGNVRFVLEMSAGWFDRHKIKAGTLISTEHGSLPDVFLRRQ
jgi:uncharacterized membrane protein (UPF0127 family)